MTYFSLFSSCTLTKGAKNSCLTDLERSTYCSIPNELYKIVENKFNLPLNNIKQNYEEEDFVIIKKYLAFLEKERFIYFHTQPQEITHDISEEQFSSSYEIEDLILDLKSFEQFRQTIEKIPGNVETVQLRIFYAIPITELRAITEALKINGNTNIEVVLKHQKDNKEAGYKDLFLEYPIISKMFIMEFPEDTHILSNQIIGLKQPLTSNKQCGKISEKLFYPNLRTYLSSQSCNSCLNRKISIAINGDIKNCPSMSRSFGNIKNTSLKDVVNHEDFKKYWGITKDEIEVCKDCEFRYICTDCRAYTENPDDIYSKPLKCGYDPYTNKWEEWSKNPLKQKAIAYYELNKFV